MEKDPLTRILFCGNYIDPDCCEKLCASLKKALANAPVTSLASIVALCVGSDKTLVDSFGPLCGSLLESSGVIKTFGNLTKPVNMNNINYYADNIAYSFPGSYVIAIDAAKSECDNIGDIFLLNGSLIPGAASGQGETKIGKLSIIAVTEKTAPDSINEKVRLNELMIISNLVTNALVSALKAHYGKARKLNINLMVNNPQP